MRFPPEFIDRLRNHIPISEVVGKRVPIKRHGREFHALCPFHKEKSPSFTVSDDKGFFHCFGCGAHGDAIGFIKDFEGVTYPEAIERLAIEAGLPVPAMTREAEEFERRRHTVEDTVAMASRWFSEQLLTPAGNEAREYLRNRGLSPDVVERFAIGFAPNNREALKGALMKQGISEAMLIEAGMLAKPDDGPTYDRFRGRVIFPIRNAQGKVVAFGGRILPSAETDKTAKYLNSPETPIFKKGEMLFSYDIARQAARETGTLLVAEGYVDVIALNQAGFACAVAPLGTAITEEQLRLLWRAVSEPVLCLDGDAAGLRAMLRAAELALPLLKPGFGLKFAILPAGEDPDSLIRKFGRGAMEQVLAQAKVLSQVLWEHALAAYGSQTPEKKAALEHYLMQMADRIADAIVKNNMRGFFRDQLFGLKKIRKNEKTEGSMHSLSALPEANDDLSHLRALEEQLVTLVLLKPEILHHSEIEEHFGHMDFTQPVLDKLRAHALEVSASAPDLGSMELQAALARLGHSEKVENLLHSSKTALSTTFRAEIKDNARAAERAFTNAYSAYTMKKLEHEMHLAARDLEREMSEKSYDRFLALQKQIDELRRARYALGPDEQNI